MTQNLHHLEELTLPLLREGIRVISPTIPGIGVQFDFLARWTDSQTVNQLLGKQNHKFAIHCSECGLEPAGGFERSVCRIRFGCSGIELRRPRETAKIVPFLPKLNGRSDDADLEEFRRLRGGAQP